MKLVLLLQRENYFVEHDKAWFRLTDKDSVDIALATLPLSVVDEFEMVILPHRKGNAEFSLVTEGIVHVTLREPNEEVVVERDIVLDQTCLANVHWLDTQFQDGWMDASSSLEVDGVGKLQLSVYLPAVEDSDGKQLVIRNETDGTQSSVFIARDTAMNIDLVDATFIGKRRYSLECSPEIIIGSTDARRLGFVLVDQFVEAA
jgi:hypothetical protein